MPENKTQDKTKAVEMAFSKTDIALNVLAGVSIGALTGALVGLSVSQVVGSVVGGLVALLGTFIGMRSDGDSQPLGQVSRVRIIAFSVGALLGIAGGVLARTHDVLAPTVASRIDKWRDAGVDRTVAQGLVVYERLGLVPKGWTESEKDGTPKGSGSTALFSAEVKGACDDLSARAIPEPTNRLVAFLAVGGRWAEVATALQQTPADVQSAVLEATWRLVCEK